jgi:hypothetical protein
VYFIVIIVGGSYIYRRPPCWQSGSQARISQGVSLRHVQLGKIWPVSYIVDLRASYSDFEFHLINGMGTFCICRLSIVCVSLDLHMSWFQILLIISLNSRLIEGPFRLHLKLNKIFILIIHITYNIF